MLAGSAVSTNFRSSAFSRRFSNRNNFLLEIAAIYSKQNWFQILAATINPCCGYLAIGPGISPGADPRCILDPMLELDCGLPFFPEFDADFFAALPARPGVILLEMKAPKAEPYLARTADIRRAAERLLATPEAQSKRLTLLEGLSGQGAVLAARLEHEREAASEALDFERAAALHKRLEKVDQALRGIPDIVRRVEDLDAVILQRGADPQSIAVFPLHRGTLVDPFHLHFGEVSEPRSVEATLRAAFEPLDAVTAGSTQLPVEKTAQPTPQEIAEPNIDAQRGLFDGPQPDLAPAERKSTSDAWREQYGLRRAPPFLSEHLSLVSRWFYSKPRDGEILFRTGDWPYRRILRACARLLNPHEKNLIPPSPSQPPQP